VRKCRVTDSDLRASIFTVKPIKSGRVVVIIGDLACILAAVNPKNAHVIRLHLDQSLMAAQKIFEFALINLKRWFMGPFGPNFVKRIQVEQDLVPVVVVTILIGPEEVLIINFATTPIRTKHLAFMLEW
jgi:hypothetical protein